MKLQEGSIVVRRQTVAPSRDKKHAWIRGIRNSLLETEYQSVTGTTKEKATPEERYLVSGARIKLFTFSPKNEVKEFDDMSFASQLWYAHQQLSLKTGIESKIQDGVQDPFQERSHDPWNGEEIQVTGTGAASSNDKASEGKRPISPRRLKCAQCQRAVNDESLVVECRECQASLHRNCLRPHWQSRHEGVQLESDDEQDKNEGKRPVEHQMFTPPQGQRVSLLPKTLIVPPGPPGLRILEKATADRMIS